VVKVEDGGTWFTGARTDCPTCLSFQDKNLTLLQLTTADGKEVDVTQMNFVPIGPQWKLSDFPLELNKAWRIVSQAFSRGTSYNYEVDIKVANYSDVKTPAGTFKAFRVRQDWVYRDRSGGTWDSRWINEFWVAPEVKHVVKFASSGRRAQEWELVSYQV